MLEKTVTQLFEKQVDKTPENIAIVFENEQLTYRELNRKANALAYQLRELGVRAEDYVAVVAERNIEMIVGILGIIKAGGAYVPIDPIYPKERVNCILKDCKPKVVLMDQKQMEIEIDVPVIELKDENIFTGNYANLDIANKPSDLLYLIYTSGTTGNPKGVMVEHQNVAQLLANDSFDFNEKDSWLLFHSFSFAFSVWEIFGALLSGAKLVVISRDQFQDSMKVMEIVKSEKITVLNQVPTAFYNLMNFVNSDDELSIRYLIFGGEALNPGRLKKWHESYPEVKIIDMYGMTETTLHVTYREIGGNEIENGVSDIGEARSMFSMYIIDDDQFCGIGMPGELCVTGAGVARGYLNHPELTDEKFVDNPYGEGKMYRSGDLARWLPDGNIEYLGRIDEQVEIRGHQIELREIENVLRKVEGVVDAAVIARGDGNKEKAIYAYFTSKNQLDDNMVQNELRKELLGYMVPTYMKQIDKMPVTLNGKLDQEALPDIEAKSEEKSASPRSETEEAVCLVFKEILGIDSSVGEILGIDSSIGIDDSFFELGGDSIKAILIVSKLRERGYQTDVRSIMQNKTPRAIGETLKVIEEVVIDQKEVLGEVALTPIQKDFILNDDNQMHHFNQSVMLESQIRIDEGILRNVLNELVRYHDILRATYQGLKQEIKPYQENKGFDLYVYDYRDIGDDADLAQEVDQVSNEIQRSINLKKGPLFKVGLFRTQIKDYLLLCIHHLVVDTVSWRILIEDFTKNYELVEKGKKVLLPQKTSSFQAWSQALGRYRESDRLKGELPYWREVENSIKNGNITTVESESTRRGELLWIKLSAEKTSQFLYKAPQAYHAELNDLLLTAVVRGISKVTNQSIVSINMEGHGREAIGEDVVIDRTVGWFTSVYPVVIKGISGSIASDLCNVKETLRRIPNYGIGYGVLKSLGEQVLEGVTPTVTFNYLGEFTSNEQGGRFVASQFFSDNDVSEDTSFGTDIVINSMIIEGKLKAMVLYDASKYSSDLMTDVCREINKQLEDILMHCLSITSPQHTASDFGELGWKHQEFMHVIRGFENQGYQMEKILPLTEMQEGMLYHKLLNPDSSEYVVQQIFSIKNHVSEEFLRQSFAILMKKHQALRISMIHKNVSGPRQIVLKERPLEFTVLNLSSIDQPEEALQAFYKQDILRGFDLETDSLLRFNLIKLSEGDYRLVMSNHHIILDGWCMSIIMNDFLSFYDQLSGGQSETEILNQIPKYKEYSDYIHYISNKEDEPSRNYWKSLLEGYEGEGCILPFGGIIDEKVEESVGIVENYLTKEEIIKLEEIAQAYSVTLNTVIEAAWGILLQRYNHQKDVVFGKVVSGRDVDLVGIRDMVGLFVNTIPVRVTSNDVLTFKELIIGLQEQALKSGAHDHYSLAEIQKLSGLGAQLVQTTTVFENYYTKKIEQHQLELQLESAREETNFDLTLATYKTTKLMLRLMYDPSKYRESEALGILGNLKVILQGILIDPEKSVQEIGAIKAEEKTLVLSKFNDTVIEYPRDKTVVELLEEQVEKTPENIAVVFEEEQLTYKELNMRANALAYKLRGLGVGPDDYVCIMAERSIEMIIGIYGVIKAGGAYVPLDPTYPIERINYILEDCQPKALLMGQEKVEVEIDVATIELKDDHIFSGIYDNLEIVNKSSDLIYLIYTSGTTGNPKGVMIEHRNVLNLVEWQRINGNYTEATTVLQNFNYIFDGSVLEIFPVLLLGCTLEIVSGEGRYDLKKVLELFPEKQIVMTPSMFRMLVDYAEEHQLLDELNAFDRLYLGGETLSYDLIERYKKISESNIENIFNVYGPTEATVCTTVYRFEQDCDKILIGRPIANAQVYIMNNDMLCGIGVPGELCIAGEGLARGYLNQLELTSEKFVDNPYGEGKLYRSGDLARWLPDGNIEYLGRIDEQVKIRGFRIELGEIECAIRESEEVKDCAVIARVDSSGDKAIYGYIVSDSELNISSVRDSLVTRLPDYMIPSYMIQIDSIPITRNGKLDKRALPEIEVRTEREYVAPKTEVEEKLCGIFEEILGIEQVGIKDSFFELGGHSLRATRLVNRIEAETGVRITLKEVFSNPTIEALAVLVVEAEGIEYKEIPKAKAKEYYGMSSAQKRIYLIQQMDPEALTYNMPQSLKLTGEVCPEGIESALQELVNRHEILRTAFMMIDGEAVQHIHERVEVDYEYVSEVQEGEEEWITEFVKPFDLGKASQLRAKVINMGTYHLLMIDMHHIISDGMSMTTFIHEFTELYNGKTLEGLTHQFKDYSEWMRGRDLSHQRDYWVGEFSDEIPVLDLPLDYVRPKEQSFEGAMIGVETGKELGGKIKALAKQTGSTEYMVFLASAMVLLGNYANQEDVVIGSPISGRTHQDTEHMLGMFVNTLVMRGQPERNKSFERLLEEVKTSSLKGYENQEYPFEELVESVDVRRDLSRNPLFDVMLVLQNNEESKFRLDGVSSEYMEVDWRMAKFDLTFDILETEGNFKIVLEYCLALFKEETVELMLKHYIQLLNNLLERPEAKLKEISMITKEEKTLILSEFNDTVIEYPRDKTVVELLEEQVEKTPENVAVVFKGEQLTYKELNLRANALAHKLRGIGVKPDDYVGIMVEKSIEMIVGLYGIIKAGGVYVPIDPMYPSERIQYIFEDCSPKVILTHQTEIETLIPVITLKEVEILEGVYENPANVNKSTDLVYCIYTSGTTGKPKGVMIEHRNVVSLVRNTNYVDFTDVSIGQAGSFSFDASTFEIWGALLNGGKVVLLPEEILLNATLLKEKLIRSEINTLFITTALYNQLISLDASIFDPLKQLLFGGEATSEEHVRKLVNRNNELSFSNIYGPTENTTYSLYYPITAMTLKEKTPIGKPLSNTQVYILNDGNLCGIGVAGELCLGGEGVARGYLNQPELTAEKFVNNPYGEGRLYRSGDLARWLPDGNIEYLGRIDEQVKIRGFRIELVEIESAIRELKDIKDCAVIVREDKSDEKAIYAYVVSDTEVNVSQIRESLVKALPEYMIPTYMMQIDSIPLTRNGKLDKQALPEIEIRTGAEYVAPRTDVEKALCLVFKEILGIKQVGVRDSFFDLGGDSIKAIRIVSKMREVGYDLNVKDIMGGRTVEVMSESAERATELVYVQDEVVGEVKLTPIIEAFESWKLEDPHHFNQSMMIKVEGTAEEVEESIKIVVSHHDMLRAVYKKRRLHILENDEKRYEYEVCDYQEEHDVESKIEEKCNLKQRSINLEKGPLFKSILFQLKEGSYLFICLHHLVVDGVSWRILIEDIHNVLKQLKEDEEINLPNKTASFKEWSEMLDEYKTSHQLSKEIPYWEKIEEEMKEGRYEGEDQEVRQGFKDISFELSEADTRRLLEESGEAYNTQINDLLLSALGMAIKEVRGQEKVTIILEGHGREELHQKIAIDRTVGWFTSMYPIILTCCEDIEESIIKTKEMLRKVPNHGIGYGLLSNKTEESDISFNYLGEIAEGKESMRIFRTGRDISEKNVLPGNMTINSMIGNGRLLFTVSYDRSKYSEEEIHELTHVYKEQLLKEISHCCDIEKAIKTPSDFTWNNGTDNDLGILTDIFRRQAG